MLKINEWSVNRRIESLRQMDKMLSEMNVGSRYTIWQEYGGGLRQMQMILMQIGNVLQKMTNCIRMLFSVICAAHWKSILYKISM